MIYDILIYHINKIKMSSIVFENLMKKIGEIHYNNKVVKNAYQNIYSKFISFIEFEKEAGMVEIGSSNSSLNFWLNIFSNVFLYSADINNDYIERDRYKLIQMDQSIEKELKNLKSHINHKLYLIIDDGSHIADHQLLTFNNLFPLLENNGVYIIENIECSYWSKRSIYGYETKYGYKHPDSIVEIFKNIVDCVNKDFIKEEIISPIEHIDKIQNIIFSRNCIIITKMDLTVDKNIKLV